MTINKYLLYVLVLLIVFGFFLFPRIIYLLTYTHAKGVVTGFEYSKGTGKYGRTSKRYPKIEFDTDKYHVTFYGPSYMESTVYTEKIVDVIYNPNNPQKAYINNFYGLWGNAFIYLLPFFLIWTIIIIGKDFIPIRVKLFS